MTTTTIKHAGISPRLMAAIRLYQIPGAVADFAASECDVYGWREHHPGTFSSVAGRLMLGMPKGFNRCGPVDGTLIDRWIFIYQSWESHEAHWRYDKLNVPGDTDTIRLR